MMEDVERVLFNEEDLSDIKDASEHVTEVESV